MTTTTQGASAELIREALDIGHDLAVAQADHVHEAYKGYKPHKHEAADRDVETIKRAIEAFATQPAAPVDYSVDDSELARKIMVFLGQRTSGSMEPGADPLRDRLAEHIALWRPAASPQVEVAPQAEQVAKAEAIRGATLRDAARAFSIGPDWVERSNVVSWLRARAGFAATPERAAAPAAQAEGADKRDAEGGAA